MPTSPMNVAVFASGGGSNFQAILDAVERGELDCDVRLCVSNRATAGALERAREHDVATAVMAEADHADERAYAEALCEMLQAHEVNFLVLAGYLRKIPGVVVRSFRDRIVNVHPSLLPAFGGRGMYGRHVHEAVLAYGVRWTGATVHLVDEAYDTGPVVLQEPVPVLPEDTPETLAARVLEVEHRLYPEALRLFAQGRVAVEGRRVRILESAP